MAFKMNGFPTHGGTSIAKQTTEAAKNLLKAVPNEDAYNKLSDIDKEGFNVAAKKAGLPTKTTIAKQRVVKEGEGQDQDKIFNSKGEHVGDYVNDKVVMKPGFKRPVVKKDTPVSPNKQKMKPLTPPNPQGPSHGRIQPNYPTFEEKNPRLHERRIPSMRALEFVHPKMHEYIEPVETYRVNPKPIEMPTISYRAKPKTKNKKKK